MRLLALLALMAGPVLAQNNTDIYLVDMTIDGTAITLSNPTNVTPKVGYDNQPFFHPSQPVLYYTSMMPDNQTDIWSYRLDTKATTPLTQTPDSEYSPTLTPDQRAFACIVQRKANGDQDLVKYDLADPTKTQLLLASQQTGKIGYQAWLNDHELVVFVLGEPQTLHYVDILKKQDKTLVPNIGRSLHRIPNSQAFSFVQKMGEKWMIRSYTPATGAFADLTESHPASEHFNVWLNEHQLLESRGKEIWSFDTRTQKWQSVALPAHFPAKNISRMAAQKGKLAVVVEE
jgi:hypothetical protein